MRTSFRRRFFGATLLVLALVVTACDGGSGGDATTTPSDGGTVEGPAITVGSFNFPESVILAEIYAQALEANGYTVVRNLNIGDRELIFPEIESGAIDFIPEYLGSAVSIGFGEEAPTDEAEALQTLTDLFAAKSVTVLDPAPGQDKNVFVVTGDFAEGNGVTTVSDLAGAGEVTLGGPPECEDRSTCYRGLVETYGLDNLGFESIAEGAARVAALESGEIQVALLFSTQPVITEKGFVVLGGTEEIIAPENVVPVVSNEVAEAYGDDFAALINSISRLITTEVLLDLNGRVEIDAENPEDAATAWLSEQGLVP
ncbi:MAG TPA: ABC transporter substrate-binding protein [Acidimicrobiia bacterium]|nr:ABC transporter substrate-binding protein [Acidimicrobiia bacterium]